MIKFPLSVVIGAVDKWTAPLAKMQARLNATFAPVNELGQKLRGLGEAAGVQRLGKAFYGVGTAVGDVLRQVGKIGAGVAGAVAVAGGAIYGLVVQTASAANAAAKAAQKAGLTVQQYQELAYAAELADVEQGTLDKGMQIFTRTLGQAALGSKGANDGFRRLGINIRGADGQIRPVGELLGETADRLNQLDDPLKRNAIAAKIFGRGAADLTPLLAEGSAGLAAYAAEARSLGVVLSDEAVRGSEEFMDSQDRVKAALAGVRNTIGVALMPAVNDLLVRVKDFFVGSRGEIAAYAQRFAAGLPERLEQLGGFLTSLWNTIRPGIALVGVLFDTFGAGPVIIGTLATVITAMLLPSMITLTTAAYSLGVALLTTPIGWIVLGVAAVVAAIVLLYKNWDAVWGFIKRSAAATWEFFKKWWPALLGPIGLVVAAIYNYWTPLKAFFGDLWDWIAAKFTAVWEWISSKLASLSGLLPDWLRSALGVGGAAPVAGAPAPTGGVDTATANAALAVKSQSRVEVSFENAPKGMRVTEAQGGGADLDLSLGYTMAQGS